MTKRLKLHGIVAALAVVGIAAVAVTYFWQRSPMIVADRLCEYVQMQQKMNCITTLADDSFVHPGSIVNYQPSNKPEADRLPLPIADIIGNGCLVPGLPELVKSANDKAGVSIPQLSYETNGSLETGAKIELPQLSGTDITAGPQWSDVQKVDLSVDDAWVTQLDENLAVQAIKSCSIKKDCVDRILARQYRVVATSLVAQGLSYKFYDRSGRLLSLDAAAKAKAFNATVGGNSKVNSTTDATLKSADPRVLGVRLLPTDIFANQPVCGQDFLYTAEGTSTVSIGGGGGKGHVGALRTVEKPINIEAGLSANGQEQSECDRGFELIQSTANAKARVDALQEGKLRFTYNIAARGGHYATAATCAAGTVIGKTGHDTTAVASTTIVGTLVVVVRSEDSPVFHVTWADMPQTGAVIRVVDWRNEPLKEVKSGEFGPFEAKGGGSKDYESSGPGTYRVETRIQLNASVDGNSNYGASSTADVTVNIAGK